MVWISAREKNAVQAQRRSEGSSPAGGEPALIPLPPTPLWPPPASFEAKLALASEIFINKLSKPNRIPRRCQKGPRGPSLPFWSCSEWGQ